MTRQQLEDLEEVRRILKAIHAATNLSILTKEPIDIQLLKIKIEEALELLC